MSQSDPVEYKLQELAEKVGISARTVRYYVQRGLLNPPDFRGRDTAYSDEHLLRLRVIRKLQDAQLSLEAIQAELQGRSNEELERMAQEGAIPRGGNISRPSDVPLEHGPNDVKKPPEQVEGAPPLIRPGLAVLRLERWELAPGLELILSERADATVRALADELKAYVMARRGQGGKW